MTLFQCIGSCVLIYYGLSCNYLLSRWFRLIIIVCSHVVKSQTEIVEFQIIFPHLYVRLLGSLNTVWPQIFLSHSSFFQTTANADVVHYPKGIKCDEENHLFQWNTQYPRLWRKTLNIFS